MAAYLSTGGTGESHAARALLWALRTCFTRVAKIWADAGYAGQLVAWATDALGLAVEIVRKLADQVGLQVLHRSQDLRQIGIRTCVTLRHLRHWPDAWPRSTS